MKHTEIVDHVGDIVRVTQKNGIQVEGLLCIAREGSRYGHLPRLLDYCEIVQDIPALPVNKLMRAASVLTATVYTKNIGHVKTIKKNEYSDQYFTA